MSSKQESDAWNERLKMVTSCPVCKTTVDSLNARIVETYQDAHLVHITCKKCRNTLLAVVALSANETQSVGLVTDLSYEDVLRFSNAQAVVIEDVMSTHLFFEKKGWALEFLQKKPKKERKINK